MLKERETSKHRMNSDRSGTIKFVGESIITKY